MKHIFLISGKAQHGKDTTAQILSQKLNGETLNLHYADYLKMIARDYLKWDGRKNDKGRTLLQWLGTERVRVGLNKPLFWVQSVCDAIEIVQEKYDYFTISDCRFPNEVYYPKARFPEKVTAIRVERVGFDNGLSKEQKNHLSETSLDSFDFDYYIKVAGGIDNLSNSIDTFIEKYIREKENNFVG